ncbi:hypothetical protein [Methylobacterium sp. Leaf456]|uniref:hypothetical protein n=1 Tax=Methylobacterium sp. Leaf456 TaxID=1736382 RepID=UPI000B1D5339|nr:hypothetical protein [Methylobacterium sp. Leaf456]
MQEPPGPAFERYLSKVDRTHPERPRYRPGPFRWRHPVPVVLMLGGAVALAAWKHGQA